MLEALLSLPLLSFFAFPMFSSYSTSLNLLFFWVTWTTLALSHPPMNLQIYTVLIARILFYFLPSLLFLAVDTLLPSLTVHIKEHGNVALPLRYGSRRLAKIVVLSVFNLLLGIAFGAGVQALFTAVHVRSPFLFTTRLPTPWKVAIDLGRGFVMRSTLQYYIHRYILHSPRHGGFVSRLHLSWAHSIKAPFAFVASYDHPLPYLLHKIVPLYLPAMLFRFHILTFMLLVAIVSLEDALTYSGYNVLPTSTILLPGMARRRDMHYLTKGKGNYAPSGVLDWLNSTTCAHGSDISEDVGDEMEKHDVKKRTSRATSSAGEFMQDLGAKARRKSTKGKK